MTKNSAIPKTSVRGGRGHNWTPIHILWGRTGRKRVAPLTLVTAPGANYYVKLVNPWTGENLIGIYIHGGWPLDVFVPLGDYELRYAAGPVWYGPTHRFGEKGSFAKAKSIFCFTAEPGGYSGYTVELIMQTNGNLSIETISPEHF